LRRGLLVVRGPRRRQGPFPLRLEGREPLGLRRLVGVGHLLLGLDGRLELGELLRRGVEELPGVPLGLGRLGLLHRGVLDHGHGRGGRRQPDAPQLGLLGLPAGLLLRRELVGDRVAVRPVLGLRLAHDLVIRGAAAVVGGVVLGGESGAHGVRLLVLAGPGPG
jgi:hypothetical protein